MRECEAGGRVVENTQVDDAVSMTRLEGKIDVLTTHMNYMAENWNLVNTRLNAHSERLTAIEQRQTLANGERQGMAQVVKVLWAILAVMLTGGIITMTTLITLFT